jgi:hypothetical protein
MRSARGKPSEGDSAICLLVRKGGLEPARYCYRQPLKLDDLVRAGGLTRILRTDGRRECAAAHARDDSIRTNSHTNGPGEASIWIADAGSKNVRHVRT